MKTKKLLFVSSLIIAFMMMQLTGNAYTCACHIPGYACGSNMYCSMYCSWKCRHASISSGESTGNETAVSNSATISFAIEKKGNVSLQVFDLTGRLVKILANSSFEEGVHKVEWNTVDANSGIYLLRMSTGSFSETQKVSIIN